MATRYFALIFGIIYTLVGILGFVPAALQPLPATAPDVAMDAFHGYLFGLFPVNAIHSIFHLAVGLWGIYAYRSFGNSRLYARSLAIIFGILAIMGLIPGLNTFFRLIPLYGHDIWLHAATALIAAYFGYRREVEEHVAPAR